LCSRAPVAQAAFAKVFIGFLLYTVGSLDVNSVVQDGSAGSA